MHEPDSNINWQHRSVETTESLVDYWHEHSTTVNQPPLSPCLARQSPLGMKRTFQTGYVTSWCIKLHHMIWHDMTWHDMMISYHRISYPSSISVAVPFPHHFQGHPATLLHPAAECKGNCGLRQCVWRRSTNLRRSRASLCTAWSSRDPGNVVNSCENSVNFSRWNLLNMLQHVTNIHGKSRWNLSTMFRHYWTLELSTVHWCSLHVSARNAERSWKVHSLPNHNLMQFNCQWINQWWMPEGILRIIIIIYHTISHIINHQ